MKFLIDECIHTSLVGVAQDRGHETNHVNWLGLGGMADWNLMRRIVADDFTFVTNNARDFRKLYAREHLHAGLVIMVPQVTPARQREIFDAVLEAIEQDAGLVNEVIELAEQDGGIVMQRYRLPT